VRPETITHPLEQTWIALCCLAIIGALVLGVAWGATLSCGTLCRQLPFGLG